MILYQLFLLNYWDIQCYRRDLHRPKKGSIGQRKQTVSIEECMVASTPVKWWQWMVCCPVTTYLDSQYWINIVASFFGRHALQSLICCVSRLAFLLLMCGGGLTTTIAGVGKVHSVISNQTEKRQPSKWAIEVTTWSNVYVFVRTGSLAGIEIFHRRTIPIEIRISRLVYSRRTTRVDIVVQNWNSWFRYRYR